VLSDHAVSNKHAVITISADRMVTITDLKSTNLTFINGTAIAPFVPTPLQDNDVIQLGLVPLRVNILS